MSSLTRSQPATRSALFAPLVEGLEPFHVLHRRMPVKALIELRKGLVAADAAYRKELEEKEGDIEWLRAGNGRLRRRLMEKQDGNETLQGEIGQLNEEIEGLKWEVGRLKEENGELGGMVDARDLHIKELSAEIKGLHETTEAQAEAMEEQAEASEEQAETIKGLHETIEELYKTIGALKGQVGEKDGKIEGLEGENEALWMDIAANDDEFGRKDEQIVQKEAILGKLKEKLSSWRERATKRLLRLK